MRAHADPVSVRISAAGMQSAQALLAFHAHNVANVSTEGYESDLATDIVGVIVASHAYTANAKVLAWTAETERSLLDVLA